MSKTWRWIIGIFVGLILIGLLFAGGSSRQAYRAARGVVEQRVEVTQAQIDIAVEMATKSVDLALAKSAQLPVQETKADLVKDGIEEIGNRLKVASEARGDVVIARLDKVIEQFNKTLQNVEDASEEATDPAVKSALDQIYGMLLATQEQITETILSNQ
jgi:hypothetical protein